MMSKIAWMFDSFSRFPTWGSINNDYLSYSIYAKKGSTKEVNAYYEYSLSKAKDQRRVTIAIIKTSLLQYDTIRYDRTE